MSVFHEIMNRKDDTHVLEDVASLAPSILQHGEHTRYSHCATCKMVSSGVQGKARYWGEVTSDAMSFTDLGVLALPSIPCPSLPGHNCLL